MIIAEDRPSRRTPIELSLRPDLSERALEKAQTGLYTQFEVQRGLPIRQLVRHFEKADEMWALSAARAPDGALARGST